MNNDIYISLNDRVFTNINGYSKIVDLDEEDREYVHYVPQIPEFYNHNNYPKYYFINGEDYLKEKYSFSEDYIIGSKQFSTILEVNVLGTDKIKAFLNSEKQLFISEQGFWDIHIFKQYSNGLNSLLLNLKEFLDGVVSGRAIDWFPQRPKKEDISKGIYKDKPFKPDRFCYWIKTKDGKITNSHENLLITSLKLAQLQHYFTSLLDLINNLLEEDQPKSNKIEQVKEETTEWTFTNNFDDVNVEKVYKHFYKMVEKKWLTLTELQTFLSLSFDKVEIPPIKFSLKKATKKDTYKLFYSYFYDIAGHPYGKKMKYVNLLGEYFEDYKSSTIKTNFSRYSY